MHVSVLHVKASPLKLQNYAKGNGTKKIFLCTLSCSGKNWHLLFEQFLHWQNGSSGQISAKAHLWIRDICKPFSYSCHHNDGVGIFSI